MSFHMLYRFSETQSKGGASYGNMYCIGHSLGSHVCGHTGKRTDSKIGRITGKASTVSKYHIIHDMNYKP